MDFERCFITLANALTEQECLDRNLFGDKAKRLDCLDEIIETHSGWPMK